MDKLWSYKSMWEIDVKVMSSCDQTGTNKSEIFLVPWVSGVTSKKDS